MHILNYSEFINESADAGNAYEIKVFNAIKSLIDKPEEAKDILDSVDVDLKSFYEACIKGKESIQIEHVGNKRVNRNAKNEIFKSDLSIASPDDNRAFKDSAKEIADIVLRIDGEPIYVSVKKKKHQNSSVSAKRALKEHDLIKLDPHGKESNMCILDENMSRSNYDIAFENIMKVMCLKTEKIKKIVSSGEGSGKNYSDSFWDVNEDNLNAAKLTMLRLFGTGYWHITEKDSKDGSKFINIDAEKIKDLNVKFKGVRISKSAKTMTSYFSIEKDGKTTDFSLIFRTSESSDKHPSRLFYTVKDVDALVEMLA